MASAAPVRAVARPAASVTFVVGSAGVDIPRPFLTIHAPGWAGRLGVEPDADRVELPDENVDSFRAFARFLQGTGGQEGDITWDNVLSLLHWGQELGVDYVAASCEAFLILHAAEGTRGPLEAAQGGAGDGASPSTLRARPLAPVELLEIAAHYELPRLYGKATELVAQDTHYLEVPDDSPIGPVFASAQIREDVVGAHVSIGLMRADGEMRRRYRVPHHAALHDATQKARLMWRSRVRFQKPPPEPAAQDWRTLQTVFPHHSLRGEDWPAVVYERQPPRPPQWRSVTVKAGGGSSPRRGLEGTLLAISNVG